MKDSIKSNVTAHELSPKHNVTTLPTSASAAEEQLVAATCDTPRSQRKDAAPSLGTFIHPTTNDSAPHEDRGWLQSLMATSSMTHPASSEPLSFLITSAAQTEPSQASSDTDSDGLSKSLCILLSQQQQQQNSKRVASIGLLSPERDYNNALADILGFGFDSARRVVSLPVDGLPNISELPPVPPHNTLYSSRLGHGAATAPTTPRPAKRGRPRDSVRAPAKRKDALGVHVTADIKRPKSATPKLDVGDECATPSSLLPHRVDRQLAAVARPLLFVRPKEKDEQPRRRKRRCVSSGTPQLVDQVIGGNLQWQRISEQRRRDAMRENFDLLKRMLPQSYMDSDDGRELARPVLLARFLRWVDDTLIEMEALRSEVNVLRTQMAALAVDGSCCAAQNVPPQFGGFSASPAPLPGSGPDANMAAVAAAVAAASAPGAHSTFPPANCLGLHNGFH